MFDSNYRVGNIKAISELPSVLKFMHVEFLIRLPGHQKFKMAISKLTCWETLYRISTSGYKSQVNCKWNFVHSEKKEEPKRLLRGSIFKNGSSLPGGTVFFLNMIMKKKMAPLCQRGAVFQNSSSEAPFWLHFFSECILWIVRFLLLYPQENIFSFSQELF